MANQLVEEGKTDPANQQQRDWLLERVNKLKRMMKDPAKFDPALAQPIADEVLRWFAYAAPLPGLRARKSK
jgi:hypothetical protein